MFTWIENTRIAYNKSSPPVPYTTKNSETFEGRRKADFRANKWVMETLENWYVIPFESLPPTYEEPNNASAAQDPIFVNKAIGDLHKLGIIPSLTSNHTVCLPLPCR